MENNNGFADMADYVGKMSQEDATKLTIESLTTGANFDIEK